MTARLVTPSLVMAPGDVTIQSDSDASGAGDIILKTGTTVRGRFAAGTGALTLSKELFVGAQASADSHINLLGNAAYANDSGMVWQFGIDSANNVGSSGVAFGDFFIACALGGTSVADRLYARRDPRSLGITNSSPTWGLGVSGSSLDTTPATLTIGHSSKAGHVADHNLLIALRNSTAPVQTGYGVALQRDDGTVVSYFDASGNLILAGSPACTLTVGGVSVLTGDVRGGAEMYANYGASTEVRIGANGGSKATIRFGGDAAGIIYLNGAGILKTDATLVVGGSLNPNASMTFAAGSNMAFATATGTKIGTSTTQRIGFWNVTPVVQQVLATGAGATVDNVISLLQTLGLCRQS